MVEIKHTYGVLVPVGPDGVGDGTLDVAATEAVRLGTGVLLLHVVHSLVADSVSTERLESFDAALTKVGRTALTEAEAQMRRRLDGRLPVTTEIVFGHVAHTIAERGSAGDTIILERRDPGVLERLVTMSVSTNVAAHAAVPVIVVPPTWSGAHAQDRPITVGVDLTPDAKADVEIALGRARDTGRAVVAFNAAWIEVPYQSVALAGYSREEWVTDSTESLAATLEGVAGTGDELTCDVRWGRPVDALVAATDRSAELVLRRRPATRLHGAYLGPLTRAVLHHAHCPVVVEPGPRTEVDS